MNIVSRPNTHFALSKTENKYDIVLEIIIPVRVYDKRSDVIDRIALFAAGSGLPDFVSLLVVDDGSSPEYAQEMRQKLLGPKIRIICTKDRDASKPFSLACARNWGAKVSRAPYLMFLDADLMVYPGFFDDILREIDILGLKDDIRQFLMCPVIYLTEEGYARWQVLAPPQRRQFFISEMLKGGSPLIEKYSSGTSAIVLRRDYFLVRGGYDERFEGWGFEDYEFACRLIRRAHQFPLPPNWSSMAGNFMTIERFEGWKSIYRLHGDWLAQKGVWLFHAPHPVDEVWRKSESNNWVLLQKRMEEDLMEAGEPEPLPDPAAGTSLFLACNSFCYTREIAPYFGRAVFATRKDFADEMALLASIRHAKADRVVFPNPYRDPETLAAYRWCRKSGFPYIVCERGALPGSVFHDRSGFLSESDSYHPDRWDKPLNPAQREAAQAYIESIRTDAPVLEQQAARIGAEAMRCKLGIDGKKKSCLFPFNKSRIQSFAISRVLSAPSSVFMKQFPYCPNNLEMNG